MNTWINDGKPQTQDAEIQRCLLEFCKLAQKIGTDNQIELEDSEILTELDDQGIQDLMKGGQLLLNSWLNQ